jgi:hypothetical protein
MSDDRKDPYAATLWVVSLCGLMMLTYIFSQVKRPQSELFEMALYLNAIILVVAVVVGVLKFRNSRLARRKDIT